MSSTRPPTWSDIAAVPSGPPPAPAAPPPLPVPLPPPVREAPAGDIVPPGGVLYKVDSSRASFGELRRDTGGLSVLIAWITKLLRGRIPGSVNDPNVESLAPFQVAYSELPADASARMGPMLREWGFAGFDTSQPVAFAVVDLFNNSRCYMVAAPRADGRAVARVVLRMEGSRVPPKTHFYSDVLTELSDGSFVWTTGAKASLDAPAGVHVNRLVGASPGQLWTAHEAALRQPGRPVTVRPAAGRQPMLDLLDRHHARIRDFHLSRRLFVPMSELERKSTDALGAAYSQGAAEGFAYPEVLAEMERLQNKKTSWVSGLVILGVSLILFVAAGTGAGGEDRQRQSRELILLLIPILLFHELGHYLAMKVFRYRNVRMFFIPFFGAAVSGTNYNAPGWKKVIVALMGPVPGIVVGGALGITGVVLHHDLLMKAGLLTLILNGSNLIPVLPLDGGRVVQALLFSRHYAADVVFRAIAALALIGISFFAGGRLFLFLGIAMLMGIPLAWRLGRVAADLKRQGATPPPSNDQKIPPAVAQVIISRLKSGSTLGQKQSNKGLAQQALTVYESLCTRPPGWLATAAFGFVHVASVVLALVLAIVLLMARGGPVSTFLRAAANQPRNSITSQDIVMSPSGGDSAESSAARQCIVANFPRVSAAANAFDAIRPRLAAGESVERFGLTLFISFKSGDDAVRRRWIQQIEPLTRDFCVTAGQFGQANLRLMCVAPTADAARDIQEQAEEYFNAPALGLIPPWSPVASERSAEWPRYRVARRTYMQLVHVGIDGYSDPRVAALSRRSADAFRQGDKSEAERLRKEQTDLIQKVRKDRLRNLIETTDGSIDPVVAENYLKIDKAQANLTDDESDDESAAPLKLDAPEYQAMAERMGRLPRSDGKPVAGAERYSTAYGSVSRVGLLITFHFVNFKDPSSGAPALVNWLEGRGCKSMKYEFRTGATPGNPFE